MYMHPMHISLMVLSLLEHCENYLRATTYFTLFCFIEPAGTNQGPLKFKGNMHVFKEIWYMWF